jgi:hypothetical protein
MSGVMLFLAAAGVLGAAQPSITNISYDYLTHSSVRIKWDTDTSSYFQVKFGVQRGVYTYASLSNGPGTTISVAIGGLKPGTTYFFRPTSRPNANDDVDICQVNLCGATELMITTPAEPAIHPELPQQPVNPYYPKRPDTTGYAVVT